MSKSGCHGCLSRQGTHECKAGLIMPASPKAGADLAMQYANAGHTYICPKGGMRADVEVELVTRQLKLEVQARKLP